MAAVLHLPFEFCSGDRICMKLITCFRIVVTKVFPALALSCVLVSDGFGQQQKWEDIAESVRKAILANGGNKDRGFVEKLACRIDGRLLYQYTTKDKDGNNLHIQVNEDGKFI